nr:CaiB/BaiF CoA-transferase family protein [Pelagicoccus mobilis]
MKTNLPLEGVLVLEFAQYLAGPYCGLRLADLGATVIKVERPGAGDACRALATKNMILDGDSLVFHTINRNKQSFAANLKNPDDVEKVKDLIRRADVMTHNFRPGVMEKIGLDYSKAKELNPNIVYGEVTGYGHEGPWKLKPGQDLLAQSRAGLDWLSGNASDGPTPFGLAIADMICGTHLAQGLIAALASKRGARVEVSLLESILDIQFELLTTFFQDGGRQPARAQKGNAHAYLGSPYGVYPCSEGHLALGMCDLQTLAKLINCEPLKAYTQDDSFSKRAEIYQVIETHLNTQSVQHWLSILEPADIWCAEVLDYEKLLTHEAFETLQFKQQVKRDNGASLYTTRCPIRIDGERLFSDIASPAIGSGNEAVDTLLESTEAKSDTPVEIDPNKLPLAGITVVDFSQFLSGPSASLRLADLGARVIKIERPGRGDICRELYVSDTEIEGESTIFHAINRNKLSYAADLKTEEGIAKVKELLKTADVVVQNFRPGVMKRLGLDYESVKAIKPDIVYGRISGYGDEGPWAGKPGQDLLVQSLSGLTQFSGNQNDGPVPMGVAVVDILAGAQLAQGLLACLVRRDRTGESGLVDVNMFESSLDLQFEPLTIYWQDGGEPVNRTETNNAHPLVGAPYGVYETQDGHLALAMGSITQLGELLGCDSLLAYQDPKTWFSERDAIKRQLADHLKTGTTQAWLDVLEPADIWCAEVLDYQQLVEHEGYKVLEMEQEVKTSSGKTLRTTRCPIRINSQRLYSPLGAPHIGEHNEFLEG